jgi:DNA-binding PadR family transcriptional regulator
MTVMRPRTTERRSEILPGTLEMLLLGSLGRGAKRGHRIGLEVRRLSSGTINISSGSLYPALKRLEKGGWLRCGPQRLGMRRAKLYRLTPAGKLHLEREWRQWLRFVAAVASVSPAAKERS